MSDPYAPDTSVNDPEEGVPAAPSDPMTKPSVEQPSDPEPDEENQKSIQLDPIGDDEESRAASPDSEQHTG